VVVVVVVQWTFRHTCVYETQCSAVLTFTDLAWSYEGLVLLVTMEFGDVRKLGTFNGMIA
jgi:hypothetical protein